MIRTIRHTVRDLEVTRDGDTIAWVDLETVDPGTLDSLLATV